MVWTSVVGAVRGARTFLASINVCSGGARMAKVGAWLSCGVVRAVLCR